MNMFQQENNHGGITVGAMGIINRNARVSQMAADVQMKGSKSEFWGWHQDRLMLAGYIQQKKVDRYKNLPSWLKWTMKDPNK